MPDIKDLKIHSFSSEDSNFPARNLVENSSITKKWKCGNLKDNSSFVVFQLPAPIKINAINIGNEGSAFIEILVRDSRDQGSEFKELLLATSFMRESDAMNQRNMNQVKCFPSDSLVPETMNHEWDLVKIVCKQPFNKNLKYGIAFITLQTPAAAKPKRDKSDDDDEATMVKPKDKKQSSNEKVKRFGRFTMRLSSSEDEEEDKKSSPFSRWKLSNSTEKRETRNGSSMKRTIEAKLSDERKDSSKKFKTSNDEEKPRDRQRFSRLIYESEDDEMDERAEEKMKRDKAKNERDNESHKSIKKPSSSPSKKSTSSHSERKSEKFSNFLSDDVDKATTSGSSISKMRITSPSKTRTTEHERKPKQIDYKPFDKLFNGVTFAFSGYVNPERGILRSKAIEMGAKYQPDWNDKCSHLICAFSNTPKYHQVKAIQGKKIVTAKWIEACYNERKRFPWRRFALDKNEKDVSESENEVHEVHTKVIDDDTKIKVLKNEVNRENKKLEVSSQKSFADVSTDEEDSHMSSRTENKVFEGKSFFLAGDLPATDQIKLKDQIISMSGKVCTSSDNVDYIIASSVKKLPTGNDKAEVLKGLWISECYELEALIPITRYKLLN